MNVELQLYASLRDQYPEYTDGVMELNLERGSTIRQLLVQASLDFSQVHLVLHNGNYVPTESLEQQRLKDGDRVGIWPPIAGG